MTKRAYPGFLPIGRERGFPFPSHDAIIFDVYVDRQGALPFFGQTFFCVAIFGSKFLTMAGTLAVDAVQPVPGRCVLNGPNSDHPSLASPGGGPRKRQEGAMPKLHVDTEVAEIDQETAEMLLEAASVGVGKRREHAQFQEQVGAQRTQPIRQVAVELDFFL
jgi:hypothetical protein